MEFPVQGMVALKQTGEATISLSLLVQMNAPSPPRAAPRTPNPEMVATWEVHSTRRPTTRDTVTQALVTVQRRLRLPTGLRTGGWSDEANDFTPKEEDEPPKKQQLAMTDTPHEESDALQGQPHEESDALQGQPQSPPKKTSSLKGSSNSSSSSSSSSSASGTSKASKKSVKSKASNASDNGSKTSKTSKRSKASKSSQYVGRGQSPSAASQGSASKHFQNLFATPGRWTLGCSRMSPQWHWKWILPIEKVCVRECYGRLSFQGHVDVDAEETDAVDAGDLYEYAFKTNVGNRLFDVLKALQIKSPCWLNVWKRRVWGKHKMVRYRLLICLVLQWEHHAVSHNTSMSRLM